MSSRSNLFDIEVTLNKIIDFALNSCSNLPYITLSKSQYEIYKKFNSPDFEGHYYFKDILLKRGRN